LGRGLDALLGDSPVQRLSGHREEDGAAPGKSRATLPLEFLKPNPHQPRKHFDDAAIAELAHSIRTKGMLQPILVRPLGPDSFEIVAGERRWRAAQRAQLHDVPVVIRELTEEEAAEIALIENVQRVDLNPIEEARAYERLQTAYKRTPDEIAKAVGKSRSHISNSIRLLTLAPELFEALETGKITAGHARALMGAPEAAKLLAVVLARDLSVRDTEALARAAQAREAGRAQGLPQKGAGKSEASGRLAPPKRPSSGKKDADTRALEAEVAAALGMLVTIEHGAKGDGAISIGYRDLDQLDEICRRLMGARI
ncbi:MAG: ParB/RepB/Spo0J family partition protein, partial [Parvularculaceae bacterium]